MSKLLSVFKSTSEKAIIARRDIYALLMLLIISATTLIFIEPLNTTIFKYFESTYSHIGIEKMLLFLAIFCFALCFYSIRRWKEIYTEANQGKELEKELRQVQSDLESQIRERTEDFSKANSELDRKNNALEILNTITRSIHTSLDIEKICEVAIEMSTTLDYVDTASIYIVSESGTSAELKSHSSNLPASYIKKASVINYPVGITWKVINSGEVEIIESTEGNSEIGPAGYELKFGSILGVPLKIEEKNAGVIWFACKEERKFLESEVELLISLSSHLSIALNRAKVYKELYKKNRYETLINSVSKVVHESINLVEVLENAVEALSVNIIKAQNVSIYLIEGENAVLKSYRGYKEDYLNKVAVIPYKKGITWKAILDRKPIYCEDSDDDVIGETGKELGTKSYVAMPIKSGNKNAFDKEELKLLEIVSAQIENAINNANYAEALRKSEELLWQKISQLSTKSKYESIIRSIADSIHESLDLQEILDIAVESIKEKIDPVEHVAIHIVYENIAVLKASSCIEGAYLGKLTSIPSSEGPIWKSMLNAQTTYNPDVNKEEDESSLSEFGIKSFVSVPLFQKGKVVGTVSVSSYEDNAFSNDDLDAFEMVSKQIEAAISNASQAEVLSISENRYRTLFEQSPLGVYLYDNDFVITNCNDRMCQIIKSPKDDIIGLDMNTLNDLKFLEIMRRGLSGEIIQHEGYYEATTSDCTCGRQDRCQESKRTDYHSPAPGITRNFGWWYCT
jgi:PAS domain S-box-containing protein